MAKKRGGNMFGSWAFLVGIIIAILVALFGTFTQMIMTILVVIGLIVGLLNIVDEESKHFMMSGIVLILAAALGQSTVGVVPVFQKILGAILTIFVPATIVVAVRNVFSIARN
jgi:ABC-type nickel/cobalt efflux system permease component RcnA